MKMGYMFLRRGGGWLGALRSRVQTMFLCGNGETITWGSNEEIKPNPTMKQLEELASEAVAGYHNDKVEPMLELMKQTREFLRALLKIPLGANPALGESQEREFVVDLVNKLSLQIDGKPEWMVEAAILKQLAEEPSEGERETSISGRNSGNVGV